MELQRFADAVAGLKTLAELERRDPKLAAGLEQLATTVVDVCGRAYGRFADTLGQVLALEDSASAGRRDALQERLREAYNHDWFKKVAEICAELHALDDAFSWRLNQVAQAPSVSEADRQSLRGLIHLLMKHEHDIEEDIKRAASEVGLLIAKAGTTGDAAPARAEAQKLINQINRHMTAARNVSARLRGTSTMGTHTLGLEGEAEKALRADPLAMVKLNMAFVVVLISAATAMLQVLPFWQFPLVGAFTLTALVVINAFHLRTSGKLSEARFLELMRLALLKLFAPLARKRS